MGEEAAGIRARNGFLVPGGVVGDGRYRLLAQAGVVGSRGNARLWRAQDGQLRREVALTLLTGSPGNARDVEGVRRTLERATHAAQIVHPGNSRVLDVLSLGSGIAPEEGLLGMVVADWASGSDIVDVIAEHPLPPATAARLLLPLASAVESAHQIGLVLGVDHPWRARITTDGRLQMAFPGPQPDATLQDDVRGLGAILYLLLTGRWPLAPVEGVPAAPIGPDGVVVAPRALFPYIPHELSAAAVHSLSEHPTGGIRTSSALVQALERVDVDEDVTQRIDAVLDSDDEDDGLVWTTRRPSNDAAKRRKLAIGVTTLAVATVAVLAWVGMQLISFFGDPPPGVGPTAVATAPGNAGNTNQNTPPPQPGVPIKPAGVQVYNVKGTPDNPRRASRAFDDNPQTTWKTDKYERPFPALKPGVGIMASFAEPVVFLDVVIDSPSEGTVVEIRTAPSEKPDLDETKVIGRATIEAGQTRLQLDHAEPSQHMLIWVTTLGEGNVSEIGEIGFVRAR